MPISEPRKLNSDWIGAYFCSAYSTILERLFLRSVASTTFSFSLGNLLKDFQFLVYPCLVSAVTPRSPLPLMTNIIVMECVFGSINDSFIGSMPPNLFEHLIKCCIALRCEICRIVSKISLILSCRSSAVRCRVHKADRTPQARHRTECSGKIGYPLRATL